MSPLRLIALCAVLTVGCARSTTPASMETPMSPAESSQQEIATLGAGCFWCVEAVLQQVDGILALRSGFMGGHTDNPTYQDICTGTTGHAEVVEVTFDPSVITYDEVLRWFWQLHDPTTLNRQGADVGTQYRSAIFVHSDEQRRVAEASLKQYDGSDMYADPFVTEITDASEFFAADDYHQNYYQQNKNQGYCHMVIAPKLKKLGLDS